MYQTNTIYHHALRGAQVVQSMVERGEVWWSLPEIHSITGFSQKWGPRQVVTHTHTHVQTPLLNDAHNPLSTSEVFDLNALQFLPYIVHW